MDLYNRRVHSPNGRRHAGRQISTPSLVEHAEGRGGVDAHAVLVWQAGGLDKPRVHLTILVDAVQRQALRLPAQRGTARRHGGRAPRRHDRVATGIRASEPVHRDHGRGRDAPGEAARPRQLNPHSFAEPRHSRAAPRRARGTRQPSRRRRGRGSADPVRSRRPSLPYAPQLVVTPRAWLVVVDVDDLPRPSWWRPG